MISRCVNNTWIKHFVRELLLCIYRILYVVLPIDSKVILFESNVGRNYTGNPKYIYEEMVNQGLDQQFNCIWILEDTSTPIKGKYRAVKRKRLRYFYYFAIAKVWVMDSRQPLFMKKKDGVIYIQTWHGTPLKKLGLDMTFVNMVGEKDIQAYHKEFLEDSKKWDYLIAQNEYASSIFRRCFGFHGEIIEVGYPRNDILVRLKAEQVTALKQKHGIDVSKKVILYAPTWRDSDVHADGMYQFNIPIHFEEMLQKLDDEWTVIIKPHYLVREGSESFSQQHVKVCSWKEDIQELAAISDLLITDYSSIMFDFALLKKPIIIYAHDLELYKQTSRDLYFDIIEALPHNIAYTEEDILCHIRQCVAKDFAISEEQEAFGATYTSWDKGYASQKCIEIMMKRI